MHEMPFERVVLNILVGKLDYLTAEAEAIVVASLPFKLNAEFCTAVLGLALEVVDKLRKSGKWAIHTRLEIEP